MSLQFCSVCDPRLFVCDFEWIGDVTRPNSTYVYSVALIHCATGHTFYRVIDPGVSAQQLQSFQVYEGCRKVTKSWLKREQAIPFAAAFKQLQNFVSAHAVANHSFGETSITPILAAHGAYRADKPVLMSAMRRTSVPFPPHWKWFDTLHFFRRVMPVSRDDGQTGYSLHAVAKTLNIPFKTFGRPHDALPDTKTLYECLKMFTSLYGAMYGWHETALTTVPGIGLRSEAILFGYNICSTEALLTFAVHCCFHSSSLQSPIDIKLHRPFHPGVDSASAPLTSVSGRKAIEMRIAKELQKLGIARALRVAHWCAGGVCMFHENN